MQQLTLHDCLRLYTNLGALRCRASAHNERFSAEVFLDQNLVWSSGFTLDSPSSAAACIRSTLQDACTRSRSHLTGRDSAVAVLIDPEPGPINDESQDRAVIDTICAQIN